MGAILDAYTEWRENNGNTEEPRTILNFLTEFDIYKQISKGNEVLLLRNN